MSGPHLLVLPSAVRDLRAAVQFYRREAGLEIANRFIDAVKNRYRAIERMPGIGSPQYGIELQIDGLRDLQIPGFPYLLFYMARTDHIEAWRVLHVRRDIASALRPIN